MWPSPSLQPPGKPAGPGRKDLGPSGFARLGPPGPGRWKCSVGFRCPPWVLPSVACRVRGRLRPGVGGQPGAASASRACSSRTWTTLPGIGGPGVEGQGGAEGSSPEISAPLSGESVVNQTNRSCGGTVEERLRAVGKGDSEFGAKPGLRETLAAPAPVPASKACPGLWAPCTGDVEEEQWHLFCRQKLDRAW